MVPASAIPGNGSRATPPTSAQGPQSKAASSPAEVSLTCQPSFDTPPNQRNICASSSWLKAGNIRPPALLTVSTSTRGDPPFASNHQVE
jgi:hypothetical protein